MYTFITFSTFYSLLINNQPTLPNAFKSYSYYFSNPVFINRRVSASALSGIKIDKWSLSAPPPFHDQQCCKVVRLVCNQIVKVSGSFFVIVMAAALCKSQLPIFVPPTTTVISKKSH